MKDIRTIVVCGRVGSEPKAFGEGDRGGCEFRMASNSSEKLEGEWKDKAEWFNVVVFGKTKDFILKNLKKGKRCLVSGDFSTRTYEKDGTPRVTLSIKANDVQIIDWEEKSDAPPF